MAQTHLVPILESIELKIDPETWAIDFDFSRTVPLLQAAYAENQENAFALVHGLAHYLQSYGEAGKEVVNALRAQGNPAGEGFALLLVSAGLQVFKGTEVRENFAGTTGDDLYLIVARGGQEITIQPGEGTDTLHFVEGIGFADISLEKSGYDLLIRVGESGQTVQLEYWYHPGYAERRIDRFALADGQSLSWQELLEQKVVSMATESGQLDGNDGVDDVLQGSMVAKAGSSETLRGFGGRDRLYAGLSSTARLYGGAEGDELYTNAAAVKSFLYGENGDDLLVNQSGSTASTYMAGGTGSDEYLIQPGSGETVIVLDGDTKSTDTLRFGEGIGFADISLEKSGYDLLIRVSESGQTVQLEYWYHPGYAERRIDRFAFADGQSLSWQELLSQKVVSAADGSYLQGNDGVKDILSGGPKSATLTGGTGQDIFLFADAPDAVNNIDRITDFTPGEDRVHLSLSVFGALGQEGPLSGGFLPPMPRARPKPTRTTSSTTPRSGRSCTMRTAMARAWRCSLPP